MSEAVIDNQLGREYYERFLSGKIKINPRVRSVAERFLTRFVSINYGSLVTLNESGVGIEENPEPAIFCVNHRSWLDIPLSAKVARELGFDTTTFPMKAALARKPYTGVLHRLGGVGVGRGTEDKEGLLRVSNYSIDQGLTPLYYGEGTRVRSIDKQGDLVNTRKIQKIRPGVAVLSLSSGVDVIPVSLAGTADDDESSRRAPFIAVVGERISPFKGFIGQTGEEICSDPGPVHFMCNEIKNSLQRGLDKAYETRETYLLES